MKIEKLLNKIRRRYQRASRSSQIVIIMGSVLLLVLSILLIIPLPELGIPLGIFSLGILSFKFAWAQRVLDKIIYVTKLKHFKIIAIVITLVFVTILFFIVKD